MVAGDDESKATVTSATPQKATSGSTEFEPPMACIRRMLKTSLPANTNVGKDACGAFSRACGIFIVYLTACANDFARESKRQTITANDVLAAVKVGSKRVIFVHGNANVYIRSYHLPVI